MKLKEVLDKTTNFFKEKKIESPRLEAELLLSHALDLERIQLYLKFDQPLKESELSVCREFVRRRVQGEPVAYILGYRDFYKNRFFVDVNTLIPRPETEHLVEEVLLWAQDRGQTYGLLDLGTGSGCIGLSLLKECPQARLVAVDISEKALEVARKNAAALEVADRVLFVHSDAANTDQIMKAFKDFTLQSSIDVLVSNPPYIAEGDVFVEENVKKFEPHSALYAADEGLRLLREWSRSFGSYLSSRALCLMEMGATQGVEMKKHFHSLEFFNEVRVIKDLSGHDRIIVGEKNG